MNDEVFTQDIRKFLRTFGVTAQREIESAVRQAVDAGRLSGTETLKVRARLEIEGLGGTVVEETIRLG